MAREDRLSFIVVHEAWYRHAKTSEDPEIMIGLYDEEGGTLGEFAIRWHYLGGKRHPKLEMFSDAWHCLAHPDGALLVQWLAKQKPEARPAPAEVVSFLLSLGLADITERRDPNGAADAAHIDRQIAALQARRAALVGEGA